MVKQEVAEKILQDGRLTVGILSCPVEKNIKMKKCYRCWAYDHIAVSCQRPDRRKKTLVLQMNAQRKGVAMDVMWKTVQEEEVNVLVVSEPSKKRVNGAEWIGCDRGCGGECV